MQVGAGVKTGDGEERRRRQPSTLLQRWLGACTIAVLATACASTGGAVGTSTSTPTSTPTSTTSAPLPTFAASIDHCVVGRWRALGGELPQQVDGASVTVTGGSGTVLTFGGGGSYSADFAESRPYTGKTAAGSPVSVTVDGLAAGTFTAQAGEINLVDSKTTLFVTVRAGGKVVAATHPSPTSSASYVCGSRVLTLGPPGAATRYSRES